MQPMFEKRLRICIREFQREGDLCLLALTYPRDERRPRWRQRGSTLPLLQAAVAFASSRGARVVEGNPVDRPAGRLRSHMGR